MHHAEDIETSLSDYQKALTILERMVEPDSRHIAELYPCRQQNMYLGETVQFCFFSLCCWMNWAVWGLANKPISKILPFYFVRLFFFIATLILLFRNFRICLCLEIGSKPQEAIPYCHKAISVCKSRVQRLLNEVKSLGESATSSAPAELDDGIQQSSSELQNDKLLTDKEAEIETLSGLCGDLEKKASPIWISIRTPKNL